MTKPTTDYLLLNLLRRGLVALAVFWGVNASAIAQDVQAVPGTTIALRPPEGFELTTEIAGFVNGSIGGSIVVTELPKGAFAQISAELSDVNRVNARYSPGGIRADSVEQLTTFTRHAFRLVHGTQDSAGRKYDK